MRQAYDYWQDQPGISRRVQTRSRQGLSPNRPALERSFSGRDVSQLSRSPGGDPTNNDLPVRRRIAARMSAGFYRTENEASQETKVHQRRDEAERFLLLAAPATRTDFSLSRELEGNEGSYRPRRSRQHRTKEATGREAPQHRSSSDARLSRRKLRPQQDTARVRCHGRLPLRETELTGDDPPWTPLAPHHRSDRTSRLKLFFIHPHVRLNT